MFGDHKGRTRLSLFRRRVPFAAAAAVSLAAVLVAQPAANAQSPVLASGQPKTVIVVMSGSCTAVAAASAAGASCAEQEPVLAQLQSAGATVLSTTSLIDTITASVSPAEAQVLSSFPGVSQVVPDATIPLVQPVVPGQESSFAPSQRGGPGSRSHGPGAAICGTQSRPELDPQALQTINAPGAWSLGIDGAGVTVATIADGIDPTNPDFQRNPAYGPAGQPVVQEVDFSGDPAGTPTDGGEMFLDASSIAAQGNQEYNIAQYVNPLQAARLPASGCWIKIVGAAPGASVLALKVFSENNDTTESGFIQAVQYAVQNGVKVINESFGSQNVPDTAADIMRAADDAAVAAGVTVVVSSGDAGVTNTVGSPASDPNLISVGASTTFRGYAQANAVAFTTPPSATADGSTTTSHLCPPVVSPRPATLSTSSRRGTRTGPSARQMATLYTDCPGVFGGTNIGVQQTGGTSESAPLTSAAAADVIQAYAQTHGGTDPTPALVKQILVSSATDIGAPADEQGAGLLNVAAAVKLAESLPSISAQGGHRGHGAQPDGGLLLGPSQVNFVGQPGAAQSQQNLANQHRTLDRARPTVHPGPHP